MTDSPESESDGRADGDTAGACGGPGELDPSFGVAGFSQLALPTRAIATGVVLDSQQRIFVAGSAFQAGRDACFVLRLLSSGILDATYGVGGVSFVYSGDAYCSLEALEDLVLMVAVGSAFQDNSATPLMMRLMPDGTLDAAFGQSGVFLASGPRAGRFTAVGRDSHDRILVAAYLGEYGNPFTPTEFSIARYLPLATLDPEFGESGSLDVFPSGQNAAHDLVVLDDDRVVAAGIVGDTGQKDRFAIARLTASGQLDPTFNTVGTASVGFDVDARAYGLAVDAAGNVVVAGGLTQTNSGVAKVGDNGLIGSFGIGGRLEVSSPLGIAFQRIASHPDGTSVIVGSKTVTPGPNERDLVFARVTQNGALDASFGHSGVALISAGSGSTTGWGLAVQADGQIVVVGANQSGAYTGRAVVARVCP